jgi:hypothetical protein
MKRREFITLFGSAALVQPVAARAQLTAPTIGFLYEGLPEPLPLMAAFRQGLLEAGIDDASGVAFENRWAEGQYDRLPALAIELRDKGDGLSLLPILSPRSQQRLQLRQSPSFSSPAAIQSQRAWYRASIGRPATLQASHLCSPGWVPKIWRCCTSLCLRQSSSAY